MLAEKQCKECSNTFFTTNNKKIYCSEKCRRKIAKRIKNAKETQARRIDIPCLICGTVFKTEWGQKYCKECAKNGYRIKVEEWKEEHKEQYKELKKKHQKSEKTIQRKKEEYETIEHITREKSILNNTYKSLYGQNEDLFILENWDKLTKKEIALKLNRTYASVISRYKKIKD